MVRSSRDAVRRLLDRNPQARVVIRGPHVTYRGWDLHYVGGDGLARFMEDILVQEYQTLRDRVVYLRAWDMTLAAENTDFHVNPMCLNQLSNLVLDYTCTR